MNDSTVPNAIDQALEGRRLLEHPFYRRWEKGELTPAELSAYATQYRHFEQALPEVLGQIVATLPDGTAKSLTAANLHDEQFVPMAHVDLFESFATAVDGAPGEASPAMEALVELYRSAAAASPWLGLGVVAAYEVQAAEIANTKGGALRTHFGLDHEGTAFWDVHDELERAHGAWSTAALTEAPSQQALTSSFERSADAWWAFLDEREALAPSLV